MVWYGRVVYKQILAEYESLVSTTVLLAVLLYTAYCTVHRKYVGRRSIFCLRVFFWG